VLSATLIYSYTKCSGSGYEFDGRLDPDPDPGSLKRAKIKGKNAAKRQIIGIKSIKSNLIVTGIQKVKCGFIFIKI
jgi:hypothetical protein